jgi:hypothetical protein
MYIFHKNSVVSIAEALIAAMPEIHVQCGMSTAFLCWIQRLHERPYKQEFALALRKSNLLALFVREFDSFM